jgi:hypothetical protein
MPLDESIKKYFDEKFDSLKRQLTEETSASITKKLRPSQSFKRKGNQKQFEFNQEVSDALDSAKRDLADGRLERAIEHIDKGKGLIDSRNKLILLADKSDFGWSMVSEYQEHELASDSEDEKRIRRAEASASRKRKESRKKKSSSKPRYSGRFDSMANLSVSGDRVAVQRPFRASTDNSVRGGGSGGPGPCLSCGDSSHWRSTCPKLRK